MKIFGERNTGTTALKALIERNSSTEVCPSTAKELASHFELVVGALRAVLPRGQRRRLTEGYIDFVFAGAPPRMAWKHTATNFAELSSLDGCPVIFTARHPASWLLGFYRHPYHRLASCDRDFHRFLQTPWILVKRDNLDQQALLPCELFNSKARAHLSLMEKLSRRNMPWQLVRFEDFVSDQKSVFLSLSGILAEPANEPAVVEGSTKDKDKDYRYYQDYYGRERWRGGISDQTSELIRRSIDWSLVRELGYSSF